MSIYESYISHDEYIDPLEDWVHISDLQKYDHAKTNLEEIIHQIYDIGDICAFENALEELASIFDIKVPNNELKIVAKP